MYEKVNPQHPDKVADRIAGAIVDLCYSKSENPKCACEVLIGHDECYIQVETSEELNHHDVSQIIHRIAGDDILVHALITPQDEHLANNQQGAIRCGDNGIFRGMPVTHEQQRLAQIAGAVFDKFPTDGKYIMHGYGKLVDPQWDVTICQSRANDEELRDLLKRHLSPINTKLKINPLGPWTGGPTVDSGATNRKLGSDMGDAVTGGGLMGKDLSKADVSVNIWCHLEAQRTGRPVEAYCSIGDETVNGIPYVQIVEAARQYIQSLGGFEKFAEWGLIRP